MSVAGDQRKSGRKSFGERVVVSSRPPVEDKSSWQELADTAGISLGNWVIFTVNTAIGSPIPDFVQDEIDKAEQLKSQPELEAHHMRQAS